MVHIRSSTNDEYGQHPLRVEGPNAGTAGERSSIIEIKAGDDSSFAGIDFGHNTAAHPGSIVYNHSNDNLSFDTNDVTRLIIDNGGQVGIGRTPLKLLDIKGGDFRVTSTGPAIFLNDTDNDSDFGIQNNDGSFQILDTTNNSISRLTIDSNGNVGIGRSPINTDRLFVDGDIKCSGLDINAGSNNEFIEFSRSDNGTTKTVGFIKNNAGKLQINAGGDVDELNLQADGSDALFITKNGTETDVRIKDNLIIGDNFFQRVNVSTATGLLRDATGVLSLTTGNLDSKIKHLSGVVDNTINVGATGAILSNNLATTGATLSSNLATTGATLSSNLANTGATLSNNLATTGTTLSNSVSVLMLFPRV